VTEPRLLIDITQYASWPATTGVQRTLLHIASLCRGHGGDARYGILHNGRYAVGPLETLSRVMRETFDSPSYDSASSNVRTALLDAAEMRIPQKRLMNLFDAYLLPEPTLLQENLDVARALTRDPRPVPFFVYFDALPLTHPRQVGLRADAELAITRYHRILRDAANIAFISRDARETFEKRVARKTVEGAVVLHLGADGVEPHAGRDRQSRAPRFTVVGTVEPRKRHQLIMDAFQQLWDAGREFELIVIGSRGSASPDLFARLLVEQRRGRLAWLERASDRVVAEMIGTSRAAIFVSEAEGYGLPAVEALALGCPIVASADLPSLQGIPPTGQIRLDPVNETTLSEALDEIADPDTNHRLRNALRELTLPTWADCVRSMRGWINETLTAGPSL
jgi:glycosyltransferase involved in cell wall biosynthesis